MTNFEEINSVNDLLKKDPLYILNWLDNFWKQKQNIKQDFNWLGLAEVAASIANRSVTDEPKSITLLWAKVAILTYEYLAANSSDGSLKHSCNNSCMNLRINMMKHFGTQENDILLDPQIIVDWFFKELNVSYEETNNFILWWKEFITTQDKEIFEEELALNPEKLSNYAHLRQRLNIINRLSEINNFGSTR